MPEKILELLENCTLTKKQIAERLDLTLSELDAVMEYLQQMGYIKSTTIIPTHGSCSSGCSGSCGNCSGSCSATSNSEYIVWELQ